MSHHNNSNIFSVILFSFFSFLFFTAFIFFFIIRYSYNFINKYYSVFCIHKIFGIQKFFVNKYYSVLVIRKFFIKEDIWSSVFGNFSWTKIFGLRYSEIFEERRSSVFGIRKFFMNEDLRSSVFGQNHSSVQLWPGWHSRCQNEHKAQHFSRIFPMLASNE